MKPRICILLNSIGEFSFDSLLQRYLPPELYDIKIVDTFPENPKDFDLIVPWNYRKIIQKIDHLQNIIVFHSSELPEGRGWAPIYYTFKDEKSEYVISAILASSVVDCGDIVMSARFFIEDSYTAPFIRKIDEELTLVMISKIIKQWPNGVIKGVKQLDGGTYQKRRYPNDNEVSLDDTLKAILPHLRGVESASPAYFYYKNVKFLIQIQPELGLYKPQNVIFEYPALNKIESWAEWVR